MCLDEKSAMPSYKCSLLQTAPPPSSPPAITSPSSTCRHRRRPARRHGPLRHRRRRPPQRRPPLPRPHHHDATPRPTRPHALTELTNCILHEDGKLESKMLRPELIVRQSTTRPSPPCATFVNSYSKPTDSIRGIFSPCRVRRADHPCAIRKPHLFSL